MYRDHWSSDDADEFPWRDLRFVGSYMHVYNNPMMLCKFHEDGATEWRVAYCERCGRKVKSPHPARRIIAVCHGWPFWYELEFWAILILAAVGLQKASGTIATFRPWSVLKVRWRFSTLAMRDDKPGGPGTQLARLFGLLGFPSPAGACVCRSRAEQMDVWGIAGCNEHREDILAWMFQESSRFRRFDWALTAVLAIRTGLARRLKLERLHESLLDEAIRRSQGST